MVVYCLCCTPSLLSLCFGTDSFFFFFLQDPRTRKIVGTSSRRGASITWNQCYQGREWQSFLLLLFILCGIHVRARQLTLVLGEEPQSLDINVVKIGIASQIRGGSIGSQVLRLSHVKVKYSFWYTRNLQEYGHNLKMFPPTFMDCIVTFIDCIATFNYCLSLFLFI